MIKLDIAQRYSKVLFNLDLANDYFNKRLKDFESLIELFKENQNFEKFLNSPQVPYSKKEEFIKSSFKSKLDENLIDFLLYLIQKKRLNYLESIASKYRNLVNEHLGIWDADMIVSAPVTSDLVNQVVKKLEHTFHKKIKVNTEIKPEIIGGAILIFENTMIDWSITGRLKKMKERLLER